MKQLLHTLYVTEENVELCLRGEAIEAKCDNRIITHIPLHNLEGIVSMSYMPASPTSSHESFKYVI